MDTNVKVEHHAISMPKSIPLQDLRKFTNEFSVEIGSGGFGTVYKGEDNEGKMIAVKRIREMLDMDDTQYLNEVQHLMSLRHENIVKLEGYCYDVQKEVVQHKEGFILVNVPHRLLCFEYMPNGSLRKHLSDESSGLSWHQRYKIIVGISNGLHHLHEDRNRTPILHLDLKPENILLDENMEPKITDFGLSRLFGQEKTHTCSTSIIGSLGYMPPEYIDNHIISKKSDVFSLGVIIIEIIAGERKYPDDTVTPTSEFTKVEDKWRAHLQTTTRDKLLQEVYCHQVKMCIKIAEECMVRDPKKRPTMERIIQFLYGIEKMCN